VIRLAKFDVPALVAALEAVLAVHYQYEDKCCADCGRMWPCETVTKIREALGEN
jgi:hypothetical protein